MANVLSGNTWAKKPSSHGKAIFHIFSEISSKRFFVCCVIPFAKKKSKVLPTVGNNKKVGKIVCLTKKGAYILYLPLSVKGEYKCGSHAISTLHAMPPWVKDFGYR